MNRPWLLVGPAEEIDRDTLQDFLRDDHTESLFVEYKREITDSAVKSIAAMANTHGGLLLIGIQEGSEEGAGGAPVGVERGSQLTLTNKCFDMLDPPFVPEIVSVVLERDLEVLVVRVRSELAPRPVLFKGTVPVRLQGRNAMADSYRLRALFAEQSRHPVASSLPESLGPRTFFSLDVTEGLQVRLAATAPMAVSQDPQLPMLTASLQNELRATVGQARVTEWLTKLSSTANLPTPGEWAVGAPTRSNILTLQRAIVRTSSRGMVVETRVVSSFSSSPTMPGAVVLVDFVLRFKGENAESEDGASRHGQTLDIPKFSVRDLAQLLEAGASTLDAVMASSVMQALVPTLSLYPPIGPAAFLAGQLNEWLDPTVHVALRKLEPPLPIASEQLFQAPGTWPNSPESRHAIVEDWLLRLLLDHGATIDPEDLATYLLFE